jgi:hypothetical protein
MVGCASMGNSLIQIPIMQQAIYFVEHAGADGGIKLTEKGFLGKNFVQGFWDAHFKRDDNMFFRPSKELECSEVTRVHCLLTDAGYVEKFKKKVCLTEKGRAALKKTSLAELYIDLMQMCVDQWNWGYADRYPDFDFIQDSAIMFIEQLFAWPSKMVTAEQFFTDIFGEIEGPDKDRDRTDLFWSLKGEIHRCFNLRFFHRFCVPFGILKDGDFFLDKSPTNPFEKTEFFVSEFADIISSKRNGGL